MIDRFEAYARRVAGRVQPVMARARAGIAGLHIDTLRWRWDVLRFSRKRGEYYEYLADMVEALQGRKSLRDLFDDDGHRYGVGSVRGRLARRWSRALETCGGDLALAWSGSMPAEELAMLHATQVGDAGALSATLRELGRAARVVEEASRTLREALAAGVVALAVASALACAVPYLTVPRLQAVFQMVPPSYYGTGTRGLFGFARAVHGHLPMLAAGAAGGIWLVLWSLPNLTGPLRTRLEACLIWRLYRDVNAIRFLSMLAVLVRQHGHADIRLRQALALQATQARPWLAWHLDSMVGRIDAGMVGADSLDTGLIERDTWWYLNDMVAAHGMAGGIARASSRIEGPVLRRVRSQAQGWRWTLLLGAVAAVLGIALWHYAVIDELRRAMTHFYAAG
jgi:hypothetical protein